MKNNVIRIMAVLSMAMVLSACGNNNSKVDQVVQEQMQAEDEKENQAEDQTEDQTEDTEVSVDSNADADISVSETSDLLEESKYISEPDTSVDVDLTALSSTMVYSEVYDMLVTPDDYIGKTVKMCGMFVVYSNEDQTMYYPSVIIADATACCSQGLEFILEGNPDYPEGYPKENTVITVKGVFETYEEDGFMYCRLKDATLL